MVRKPSSLTGSKLCPSRNLTVKKNAISNKNWLKKKLPHTHTQKKPNILNAWGRCLTPFPSWSGIYFHLASIKNSRHPRNRSQGRRTCLWNPHHDPQRLETFRNIRVDGFLKCSLLVIKENEYDMLFLLGCYHGKKNVQSVYPGKDSKSMGVCRLSNVLEIGPSMYCTALRLSEFNLWAFEKWWWNWRSQSCGRKLWNQHIMQNQHCPYQRSNKTTREEVSTKKTLQTS